MGSIPSKPRRANWLWFTRGISASPCRSSITYNYCIYIFLIYMQEDFGFHLSKDGLGPATTPRSRSAWTNLFNEIWRGGSLLLFFRISREHTRRGLGEFRFYGKERQQSYSSWQRGQRPRDSFYSERHHGREFFAGDDRSRQGPDRQLDRPHRMAQPCRLPAHGGDYPRLCEEGLEALR